ncbi:MAG: tRNA uridine-5-carboxymethylaminomethyl(34) synthesis GTPase MnmE, partial [Phenylobacterium sp.]
MTDTIFAVATASGRAAVAVVRLSGPRAGETLSALAGRRPPPRRAALRRLRDAAGDVLDEALVLWMPGPGSYTGEDSAELHLHGGPAVIAGVMDALAALGLRLAEPGEFTRRAFENGRLDLAQAEGVADLVEAETEAQRRQALDQLDGALGRARDAWRSDLVEALALFEAAVDFPDEDLPADVARRARPALERL